MLLLGMLIQANLVILARNGQFFLIWLTEKAGQARMLSSTDSEEGLFDLEILYVIDFLEESNKEVLTELFYANT